MKDINWYLTNGSDGEEPPEDVGSQMEGADERNAAAMEHLLRLWQGEIRRETQAEWDACEAAEAAMRGFYYVPGEDWYFVLENIGPEVMKVKGHTFSRGKNHGTSWIPVDELAGKEGLAVVAWEIDPYLFGLRYMVGDRVSQLNAEKTLREKLEGD